MAGHDAGDALIDALVFLGNSGVNVALNDFGSGHANLVQLRDLPAKIVKIDRSFIARLSELACNQQVVAEGVENDVQR